MLISLTELYLQEHVKTCNLQYVSICLYICVDNLEVTSVSDRLPTITGTRGPNSTWEGPMTTQFSPLSRAFIQE